MKTIKTTLIAALLLFTVNAALAQDKYEYAMITTLNSITGKPRVLINDEGWVELEISKEEIKNGMGLGKVFKQIKKMETDGWELFNIQSNDYFYLRKKVS